LGWLLFIASTIFFVIASINSGDVTSTIASLLFLLACLLFLVPFLANRPKT
jgi:uncharacterized membrane protein YtjA (UPF0391 family)